MNRLNIWMDMALALAAIVLLVGGKYGTTRQMALLPLLTAVLDGSFVSVIAPSLTPVLSTILLVLQGLILTFSGWMVRRDRVRFRNKQQRRRRQRELIRSRMAFELASDEAEERRHAARKSTDGRVCA